MLLPSWYREARQRSSGPRHHRSGPWSHARALGLTIAVVLASVGCGAKEQVVYVDPIPPGGYAPISRSTHPRVHADEHREAAADVQIGPAPAEDGPSPYMPIAQRGSQVVHASAASHAVAPPVAIAGDKAKPAGAPSTTAPSSSHSAAAASDAHGAAVTTVSHAAASAPKPGAAYAARLAASPTPAARLALGPALGATAGTPTPSGVLTMDEEKDEGQASIVGKIESITGPLLKIQTPAGLQRVRLAEQARVEREAMGATADLKPGQFVGILHLPSGPADAVRLYATGPSMPRPGIAPMVGSRSGQVTTFGSIVKLEFGGLLLNTGSQTTMVTLPSGVPILRPAPQNSPDLAVGTQVIASGPIDPDGSLVATSVRVTGEARPVARSAQPGR